METTVKGRPKFIQREKIVAPVQARERVSEIIPVKKKKLLTQYIQRKPFPSKRDMAEPEDVIPAIADLYLIIGGMAERIGSLESEMQKLNEGLIAHLFGPEDARV